MKKICKEYVPLNRDSVQKRIKNLEQASYILKNRPPDLNEIKKCTPYLDEQIKLIQPRIIVPLGNFSTEYIFEKFGLVYDKISRIHGKTFQINTLLGKITIIPMYHPAVATYNPNTKNTLLEDFKIIKKVVESK